MRLTNIYPFAITLLMIGCKGSNQNRAIEVSHAGLRYLNSMQYDSAIVKFKQAAAYDKVTDEVRAGILRNLAVSFSETLAIDSARKYYAAAAAVSPKSSYEYLVNTADVNMIDDEIGKAIEQLEKAVEIEPNKVEANNSLGLLYLGEYDFDHYNPQKALRYNMKANAINSDRNTHFVLAKNYYLLKKYPEAIEMFTKLYRTNPDNTDYLSSLILIHEDAGNENKVEDLLRELQLKDSVAYAEYLETKVE